MSIQNGEQTVPCGFSLDRNDFQSFDALASTFNQQQQQQQRIENGANFPSRHIEMRMRMHRVYLSMRTKGIKAFSNGYGVVAWTGDTKTISVDANLFENGAKQLRFRSKTD